MFCEELHEEDCCRRGFGKHRGPTSPAGRPALPSAAQCAPALGSKEHPRRVEQILPLRSKTLARHSNGRRDVAWCESDENLFLRSKSLACLRAIATARHRLCNKARQNCSMHVLQQVHWYLNREIDASCPAVSAVASASPAP